MSILFALLAAACYALQNNLMTFYYRRTPALDAATHRGLILGVSGLPLLFLAPPEQRLPGTDVLQLMLVACLCGTLGNMYYIRALTIGRVGIAAATVRSVSTIGAVIAGLLFFGEQLTVMELAVVCLIIYLVICIGQSRHNTVPAGCELPAHRTDKLVRIYAITTGLLYAVMFIFLTQASRLAHPFVTAYMLEFGVGLGGLFLLLLRKIRRGKRFIHPISLTDCLLVMIYSSPTILGTPLSNFSLRLGNVGVATAVLSSNIAFNCILAWLIHKEKLSRKQVVYIAAMLMSIVVLHIV